MRQSIKLLFDFDKMRLEY